MFRVTYKNLFFTLLALTCLATGHVQAQTEVDSNYVKSFEKANNIKSISGLSRTAFRFTHITNDQLLNKRRIEANTRAFSGINLNYKWLSLEYDWDIPNTAVDNHYSGSRAFSLHAFQVGKKFGIEGNYQRYKGLVLPIKNTGGQFDHFNNVNYNNYSINLYYFLNFRQLSYSSAYKYSVKQKKSSGSIITMLTPAYQSFNVNDTLGVNPGTNDRRFIEIIQKEPKWFTLLGRVGYTYNIILNNGNWSINPSVLGGTGSETPLNNSKFFKHTFGFVNSFQGRVNGGYNGDNFFVYLNVTFDKTEYHLMETQLTTNNNYYSFNVGYRFASLKEKILRIL
ncbi:MAG: DUF4421 family protein [Chitinophagaceae bacterium]